MERQFPSRLPGYWELKTAIRAEAFSHLHGADTVVHIAGRTLKELNATSIWFTTTSASDTACLGIEKLFPPSVAVPAAHHSQPALEITHATWRKRSGIVVVQTFVDVRAVSPAARHRGGQRGASTPTWASASTSSGSVLESTPTCSLRSSSPASPTTASADVALKGLSSLLEAMAKLRTNAHLDHHRQAREGASNDLIDQLGLRPHIVSGVPDERIVELYAEAEIAANLQKASALPPWSNGHVDGYCAWLRPTAERSEVAGRWRVSCWCKAGDSSFR